MKFSEALAEDRRLAMLRLLVETGGEANESVLEDGLALLGHTNQLTRENVRSDLELLAKAGAITISWFGDKIAVAKITRRGAECAAGRITIEGVKKPSLWE